jgi:hypothetical protein
MLEPGGYIVEHIDAGPYYERWQLPFTTGSYGTFTQQAGVPFPVRHYDWHHVANDADEPRISLVIDRDVPLPISSAPFSRRPTDGDRA